MLWLMELSTVKRISRNCRRFSSVFSTLIRCRRFPMVPKEDGPQVVSQIGQEFPIILPHTISLFIQICQFLPHYSSLSENREDLVVVRMVIRGCMRWAKSCFWLLWLFWFYGRPYKPATAFPVPQWDSLSHKPCTILAADTSPIHDLADFTKTFHWQQMCVWCHPGS